VAIHRPVRFAVEIATSLALLAMTFSFAGSATAGRY
jgi:hypothetical protein